LERLEKNRPPGDGLAAESSEGLKNTENHTLRVARYSKAKSRAVGMQAFIKDREEYQAEYLKLKECGNYLKFLNYYTVGKILLHQASFCKKHLLCPLCAIRRGSKYVQAYGAKVKTVKSENSPLNASLITLTVKNGNLLNERFNHLDSSRKKLNKKRRNAHSRGKETEWSKILGSVGTYELTKKNNGWHPHAHIFAFHQDHIYQGALAKEWLKTTGDSFIVDVTPVHNPDEPELDFLEVFKYSLKFHDLDFEDNLKAYDFLSYKKLVFSTGILRGVKVPDSLLDEPINQAELPYVEMLYKYYSDHGYKLESKFTVPF